MKLSVIALLMAISLSSFAKALSPEIFTTTPPKQKNTVMKIYSNFQELLRNDNLLNRSKEYPTQIVRVQGDLNDSQRYCHAILKDIEEFFTNKITADKFYYNTLIFCSYDPDTEYATKFSINSYFDPLSDQAIDYLQAYLAEHNGRELLGVPFEVEEAKAVVVSLSIDSGKEVDRNNTSMLRYKHDHQSHYFSSNYALIKELVGDIRQRFFSNDPDLILPFMRTWFFSSAGEIYYHVLKRSNYVELQPEKIFLMNKEPKVYTSPFRIYFSHHCLKYENKRCL